MKRLLVLILLVLLLAGCVGEPDQTTDSTPVPTTQTPTVGTPVSVPYDPDSGAERNSGGAVKAYPLDRACLDIELLGDELLVCYDSDVSYTISIADLYWCDSAVTEGVTDIWRTSSGAWYYAENSRSVVLITPHLQNVSSVLLPEEALGIPVVSDDLNTIFYCTDDGIRALDVESGVARLLRQESGFTGMDGVCFDGEMLVCRRYDGVVFIMGDSGIQLDADQEVSYVDTYDRKFFLLRSGMTDTEYLYGDREGSLRVFLAPEDGDVISALALGGAITVTEGEGFVTLDFFDLESGQRTSSVTLDNVSRVRSFVADAANGCIWFLGDDSQYEQDVLYRWDTEMSSITDDAVYTSPRYTAASPDLTGLEVCRQRAQTMSETYGLNILIWVDAVQGPWVDADPEYRVDVINDSLDRLEGLLARFPEGMLSEVCSISNNGTISVSLVAELGDPTGQQVWVNGCPMVAVEIGNEMEDSLYNMLYRVIDTYVLTQSSVLDEWDADNPTQARAELFAMAMTEGMEDHFQTKSVQSQLQTLCKAIRDAFGMKKYEGVLPWEQYLDG